MFKSEAFLHLESVVHKFVTHILNVKLKLFKMISITLRYNIEFTYFCEPENGHHH